MYTNNDNELVMTSCHDRLTRWQDDICVWQYDTDVMTWHDDIR